MDRSLQVRNVCEGVASLVTSWSTAFFYVAAGLAIYVQHRSDIDRAVRDLSRWATPRIKETIANLPTTGKLWEGVQEAIDAANHKMLPEG